MVNRAEKRRQKKLQAQQAKKQVKAQPAPPSVLPPEGKTVTMDGALKMAFDHYTTGDLQKAESYYRQILAADPNQPEALNFLGMIGLAANNAAAALELIDKALALKPDYASAHSNKAIVLNTLGQLEQAACSFQNALRIVPDDVENLFNYATVLLGLKRYEDAIQPFEKVLALDTNHTRAMNNLAIALNQVGRDREVIEWLDKLLKLDPSARAAYYIKGLAHWRNNQLTDAETWLNKAIDAGVEVCHSHYTLGQLQKEAGRMEEAEASFRAALKIDPNYGFTYLSLVSLKKGMFSEDEIRALEAAYQNGNVTPDSRIPYAFALGNAFEELGDYETAFRYFKEGNALKSQTFTLSFKRQYEDLDAMRESFTPDVLARYEGAGCSDTTPIFIVGMPRSGTTLVEQILAAHPDVFGGGELFTVKDVINDQFGSVEDMLAGLKSGDVSPEAIAAAGAEYVKRVRELAPDSKHITDKMPANFANLGMIKLMLPNAKVIHCDRDARDVSLSLFTTLFENDAVTYAYDLSSIGAYYKLYTQCMEQWRDILPDYVFENAYETLIADQETQSRALINFVGLDWDGTCLDFHRTKRNVRTASVSQVRKPIYKSSMQRWKHFEPWLGPLFEALEN